MKETGWRELCEVAKCETDLPTFLAALAELESILEAAESSVCALSQRRPGFSLLIH